VVTLTSLLVRRASRLPNEVKESLVRERSTWVAGVLSNGTLVKYWGRSHRPMNGTICSTKVNTQDIDLRDLEKLFHVLSTFENTSWFVIQETQKCTFRFNIKVACCIICHNFTNVTWYCVQILIESYLLPSDHLGCVMFVN